MSLSLVPCCLITSSTTESIEIDTIPSDAIAQSFHQIPTKKIEKVEIFLNGWFRPLEKEREGESSFAPLLNDDGALAPWSSLFLFIFFLILFFFFICFDFFLSCKGLTFVLPSLCPNLALGSQTNGLFISGFTFTYKTLYLLLFNYPFIINKSIFILSDLILKCNVKVGFDKKKIGFILFLSYFIFFSEKKG